MKATGIVRRIDDLGRIVIPKEIRRTLRIREGDPLEIFTDREGEVILKKYSPVGELGIVAEQYAESLSNVLNCIVCITDHDQVVAAAGNGKKEFEEQYISKMLGEQLQRREVLLAVPGEKQFIMVVDKMGEYEGEAICPILCNGDVIGGIVFLNRDKKRKFGEMEQKLIECAAGFLGRQMEQ